MSRTAGECCDLGFQLPLLVLCIQPLLVCCIIRPCWNWQIIDDVKERWENTDSPIVHKIQEYGSKPCLHLALLITYELKFHPKDVFIKYMSAWLNCPSFYSINEAIFQETNAAASIKEIHARDPYDHIAISLVIFILVFRLLY